MKEFIENSSNIESNSKEYASQNMLEELWQPMKQPVTEFRDYIPALKNE